jgi:serine protease Do
VKLTGAREKEPEIPAVVIAADREHDLALLRLEKPGPYPFVEFGRSDDLMLGETVIAIGNPFGLGRTVTTGIISALDRSIDVRDARFSGLIQTDAAVNRGNSGGPLVNIEGEFIGVNSAIYSLSGGADGISFAIPVADVRRFLIDSLKGARFSGVWLGLRFQDEPDGRVSVERVFPSGPAAAAGLQPGARVVRPGDALQFCFDLVDAAQRGEFTFAVSQKDGSAKPCTLRFEAPPTESLAWKRLGVRVSVVTDDIAERTGFGAGAGLVVTDVRPDSPANRVGLERGDLLLSIGADRLDSVDDLLPAVLGAEPGEARELKLVRAERSRFATRFDNWRARIVFE